MKKQNKNGVPDGYQRITEILSVFSDFSQIDPATLANAADRGTRTHKFCELYINNLLLQPIDEDCKPYFESFVKWFDEMVKEVVYCEERLLCDKFKITGQIDLLLTLKGENKPIIVDLKTPQSESKTWRLQTAAYLYLARQNWDKDINRRACLMLDRNGGEPKFKEYASKGDEQLFFNALELVRFFK